jgi:hypothetical protein
VLTTLLLAEGATIIDMGRSADAAHGRGLVLIPPILVKLGSTGYRFARYDTRAPAYLKKGPPLICSSCTRSRSLSGAWCSACTPSRISSR